MSSAITHWHSWHSCYKVTIHYIYIYIYYTFNIIRHLLSQLQLFHWKRCRCNSCSFALTCFDIPGLSRPQSAVSHPAERPWPCKSWSPAVVWNNLKHEKIIKDLYWPRWRRCDKTNFRLWILRIGSSFHTSSSLDIIVMWADGMMELGNSWRLWWQWWHPCGQSTSAFFKPTPHKARRSSSVLSVPEPQHFLGSRWVKMGQDRYEWLNLLAREASPTKAAFHTVSRITSWCQLDSGIHLI